ncbi:L-asparaginase [Thermoplasma volcanium GSS1]|uniref:Glutamyl-tRNA(Gln) amidotransferase subunit D n=1 Tax=Thermoplasma volcanium (strain ATCC 51530 / DSM 4299 / JCM 9571 / NBRC 15438 / GSS1) TaxID=273116 RepID=GATD_THEVO|nr:Glu-tRNA(Gln) amidotransferase subunit GatD [Thermoplasma volcanium]Q979L8.1 RecName: Full=Glutamyl-tRNA(Gln) amidotransferase subunit D; Short=Glu-ADT subunit D [Thermoplasma volcanium GSS1]BAB60284.1 L-asparaginase [Thermoplasma volcanium GSS1]
MQNVEIIYKNAKVRGILINEANGLITIKADNGYNLTFDRSEVEILSRVTIEEKKEKKTEVESFGTGEKSISILATGGTIASRVDYETGAVKPVSDPRLLFGGTELESKFNIRVVNVMNQLSENMKPADWIHLARKVMDETKHSSGIVVSHGTDTMSYTSSALAFMFERLAQPIIFVGSQRSSDRPSSDTKENMEGAINFAATDLGEVGIAMHKGISDGSIVLHRAVRSRKMHTSRRDAFESIDTVHLAEYTSSVRFFSDYRKAEEENLLLDHLDEKVSIIYFHPGLVASDVENMIEGKHAVVIMGTGLGHIAKDLIPVFKNFTKDGNFAIMTSQCIYGSVDMNVYSTGRELIAAGVISAGDMVPEVAYVKAMFTLGNYGREEFINVFNRNLRGEILNRLIPREVYI